MRHPDWTIARKMRALFTGINRLEALEQSVKLNLNFYRAPRSSAWRATPAPIRRRLESFCEQKVGEIIEAFEPRLIVCEGLHAYDRLLQQRVVRYQEVALRRENGGRLYCRAEIAPGIRLVSFPHPCGMAQPRRNEWPSIGKELASDMDLLSHATAEKASTESRS
jgi:hypothetical protein